MLQQYKTQKGFTLVELSIVLVIIGLIISSVLVGQDLIRSAEMRSSITQYEGFNAAVATFRGKYNGLPGDIAGATNFGFTGDGNNNGNLSTSTDLAADSNGDTGENVNFWNHLGSTGAALVAGSFAGAAVTSLNIASNLPAAKAGNYWGVYAASGVNYYILGVLGNATGGVYTTTDTLTPLEAKSIDEKVDDGRPVRGIVQAKNGDGADADAAPDATGADACVTAATAAGLYSTTTSALANAVSCTLRFKIQ